MTLSPAESLNKEAVAAQIQGDLASARKFYLTALEAEPDYLPALANLAAIASERNELGVGIVILKRLVQLVPQDGNQWNNLGNLLTRSERYDEADFAFARAAELCPDNTATWHNLGLLRLRQGRYFEAVVFFNRVQSLGHDSDQVHEDIAHAMLADGSDLPSALDVYEARWHRLVHLEPWDFYIKEWQGEDLAGKSILLHAEQGFGDTIMTARFVTNVRALGARVTLAVPPALVELFLAQDNGIDVINVHSLTEAEASHFDFHSPLYSTMRWLGVTRESISPAPYIKAPDLMVAPPIRGAFNVGICWASGRRGTQLDWRRRHSPLSEWLKLAQLPNVHLWSLCIDHELQTEVEAIGAEMLVHRPKFANFAETAAFIASLDLVISVDTAVAHLAAAMGKPTWMLSQFTPCWRWWDIHRGDTGRPWYQSMRILPQHRPGDWESQLYVCHRDLSEGESRTKEMAA